jgi:AbiV family abortive infection protein
MTRRELSFRRQTITGISRAMAIDANQKKQIQMLMDGLFKTFQNADELYDEAHYLAERGSLARAVLLHQISLEECGKAEMLCVAIFSAFRGEAVDMKQLRRSFSRHEGKNRTNAYFLPKSEVEEAARETNDIDAAIKAFDDLQTKFHKDSNTLKNASLYVDFDGKFVSPRDVVTEVILAEMRERNREFMAMAYEKVSVVRMWGEDIDAAAERQAQMMKQLGIDGLDQLEGDERRAAADGLLERINDLLEASRRSRPEKRADAASSGGDKGV